MRGFPVAGSEQNVGSAAIPDLFSKDAAGEAPKGTCL